MGPGGGPTYFEGDGDFMKLTQTKFLTDDELDQLRKNLAMTRNQFHVLLVEFALFTGARSAEIVEVRTSDLNNNGTVTIKGKKGSNDKTVPLPPAFFQRLKKYVSTIKNGGNIFPVSTRMFRKIWANVTPNKDKSLHSLRHTMGVKLYNNCEDIHAVKTMLGHKNISSSMVYLDFIEGNRKLKNSIKNMWNKKLDVA